ncbi:hypothetical protein PIB30_070058 [Stylosanthes scabra]|uniref:MULE transposase domain-containing protein n=1 Tax=Stylosanthes scabra TaxID=79078 RepID=A0ABU6QMZ1_9FABA|nr:hypothetical protein [Stylosanthes scabra]
MNLSDFVVLTLYPNGEMGRDSGGIWFRSATPVVFQMQLVNTLEELKAVILRNMGVAGGTMLVRQVAYRLLNIFPPNQYETREVMELLTEMQIVDNDVGGPSSSAGGAASVIPCLPIHFAAPDASMQLELNSDEGSDEDFVGDTDDSSEISDGSEFVPESQCRRDFLLPAPTPIPDLSSVSSHFHTLHLHDMGEEPKKGFGGGSDDYDVDGGQEFRVGHHFSTREVVQMAVKNYSIRRAFEYRVVESDLYKEVQRFGGPHDCLAPTMRSLMSNPSVRISVLQAAVQQSYSFMPSYRKYFFQGTVVDLKEGSSLLPGRFARAGGLPDGNNNIFPATFAIVESESIDSWSFFLKNLRTHVIRKEDRQRSRPHFSGGQWVASPRRICGDVLQPFP